MSIIKSNQSNKKVIENMMQLYLHDLSPFTNDVPNEKGLFSLDDYFDCYWEDSDRFPYIFMNGKQAIGFALVLQHAISAYSSFTL